MKTALWLTWLAIGSFFVGYALAVTTGPWSPSSTPGCRVVDAVPSYSAGQLVAQTCDTAGRLRVLNTVSP